MYPTLFYIGPYEITSFGVLVAIGAFVGLWLFGRELSRSGLPESASNAAVAGVFGGLVGAKLLWTVEHLADGPALSLLFSRGGMSWFGGLIGGVAAGLFVMWRQRLSMVRVLAAATPGLAIGHAIGRVGCFLVGDDYGKASDLPWAMAFPDGRPPTVDYTVQPPLVYAVHPTQIYEALALVVVAVLLFRWRRQRVADVHVLARYFVLAGIVRFGVEFLRVDTPLIGPLTLAHMIAGAVALVGVVMLVKARPDRSLVGRT